MEDIFTLILLMVVVYMVYEYGTYKRLSDAPPCKIIYKLKEEKNVV